MPSRNTQRTTRTASARPSRPRYQSIFYRHGLRETVRRIPPGDELGPAVVLGAIQLAAWGMPKTRLKRFVATADRDQTATFMCLCAVIGQSMTQKEFAHLLREMSYSTAGLAGGPSLD